jgi:DNA transformation protein
MSASTEYTEYVLEQLAPTGPLATSRFFGGVGLSRNTVQFAMIMGNSLYFVVDDTTREKYTSAGMTCFSYLTRKGRIQVRKYFELPEEVLTDPEELQRWAKEAARVAAKSKKL